MFSTFAVFCFAFICVAIFLLGIIASDPIREGKSVWKEFSEGTAREWGAVGLCQAVITTFFFAFSMPVNHYVLAPSPPQKHEVVELDRVYDVDFPFNGQERLTITFDTQKNRYYEEEGFEFEWVEGEGNPHRFSLSSAQSKKIQKEMELNKGKRHTLTHTKDKLVSFYPNE